MTLFLLPLGPPPRDVAPTQQGRHDDDGDADDGHEDVEENEPALTIAHFRRRLSCNQNATIDKEA